MPAMINIGGLIGRKGFPQPIHDLTYTLDPSLLPGTFEFTYRKKRRARRIK